MGELPFWFHPDANAEVLAAHDRYVEVRPESLTCFLRYAFGTPCNFGKAGWPWYNFRSSGIVRFVQGGVVKTFRCRTQAFPMDDDELLEIASKLEAASDNDAAHSQLTAGKPWLWLTGNRDALLRFAAAFIRAAAAPIPDDECRAEPSILEHRQINDAKTDYTLGAAQRIDEFPENPDVIAARKRRVWDNDGCALIGCGVVGFIIISLLISGVTFWWHLITGTPLR